MTTVGRAVIEVDADLNARDFERVGRQAGDGLGDGFGDEFSNSARRGIIGGASDIVSGFGRAFQGGIVSNPYIIAGVIAAIGAAMPAAGTLAAGSFILAFGAGIAGLGLVFAAQNQQVRSVFSSLGSDIAATMRRISAPLVGTLLTVATVARSTFQSFVPALTAAFAAMAPALSGFARNLGAAFTQLTPAVGPLTKAFGAILDSLGPKLIPLFDAIADSLITLSESIDADAFATLLTGVLYVIPGIINFVSWLQRAQEVLQPWYSAIASTVSLVTAEFSKLWDEIGPIVGPLLVAAFKAMGTNLQTAGYAIAAVLAALRLQFTLFRVIGQTVANVLIAAWQRLGPAITAVAGVIRSVISALVAFFRPTWNAMASIVSAAWRVIGNVIRNAVNVARRVITTAWNAIRAVTTSVWNAIRTVINTAMNAARGAVTRVTSGIRSAITRTWSAVRSATSSAWNAIRNAVVTGVNAAASAARSLGSKLLAPITGLASKFYSAGSQLMSQLAAGIRAGISRAVNALASAARRLKDMVPGSPVKDGPLRVFNNGYTGRELMRMLAGGIDDGAGDVQRAMDRATTGVAATRSASQTPVGPLRVPGVGTSYATGTAAVAAAGGVQINQIYNGPTTSGGRLREIDQILRFSTPARRETAAGLATL